jgi:hypothetical protein
MAKKDTTDWLGGWKPEHIGKLAGDFTPEAKTQYARLGAMVASFTNLTAEAGIKILKDLELWKD